MQVIQHDDPKVFADRVGPFLLQRECENCALIGLVDRLAEGHIGPPSDPMKWMLTMEVNGDAQAVAVQTREQSMVFSRIEPAGIETVAKRLLDLNWPGRGFFALKPCADALAAQWTQLSGQKMRLDVSFRLFQLSTIAKPRQVTGTMRQATIDDKEIATHWCRAFAEEIGEPDPHPEETAHRFISQHRLFLWTDPEPCAMTGIAGPTASGIRINYVYTPRNLRSRGYASNLVAHVSQKMFDSGRRFCFLFTDLANPTSNKIYQQIGYKPVADFVRWCFDDCDQA